MGRPKGSKNKSSKKAETIRLKGKSILTTQENTNKLNGLEIDMIIIDEVGEIPHKKTERYCKECNGILFGGQIIHKKGCRNGNQV